MKKFMKICALLAAILIVLGLVVGGAASAIQGPRKISDIVDGVTKGKLNVNLDPKEWGIEVGDDVTRLFDLKKEYNIGVDLDSNMDFDKDYPILKGSVDERFKTAEIDNLDVEIGACEMNMKASDDGEFRVEAKNVGKMQCFVDERTLNIKAISKTNVSDKHCVINLYVPQDFQFAEAEIELGAGALEFDGLHARAAEIEVGAGGIGLENADIGKLEAEVGMGGLKLSGIVREKAALKCAMGAMEIKLDGSQKDYNYHIESAMGNVMIGGRSVKGLAEEKDIDNGADRDITLECSMGSIEISFAE